MIVNINYKAITKAADVAHLKFTDWKPQQFTWKGNDYKIIIFRSGNCRIMGCKRPIPVTEQLPFNIVIDKLQSITLCCNLETKINLNAFTEIGAEDCFYDAEVFPAVRYVKYNPLCVNVFASGKVIIMGIRTLDFQELEKMIMDDLFILCCEL